MTTPKHVKWLTTQGAEPCEPTDSDTDPLAATGKQPAGRIVHDERGNAIWKWAGDSSSTGTSSGILKYLDPRDLNVEAQGGGSADSTRNPTRATESRGGYDPYNQGELRNKTTVPAKKKQTRS